jgi:hypothetical protein
MPSPLSWSKHSVALAAAGALALGTLATGVWGPLHDSVKRGGPLAEEGWMSTGTNVRPGSTIAVAPYQLNNPSDQRAVLDSVRPIGVSKGLRLIDTYAVGKQRPTQSAGGVHELSDRGTFRKELFRPVRGFVATPDVASESIAGTNLVLVYKVEGAGPVSVEALEVRYHVGDQRYRHIMTMPWYACVRTGPPEPCELTDEFEPPSEEQLDRWYDETT